MCLFSLDRPGFGDFCFCRDYLVIDLSDHHVICPPFVGTYNTDSFAWDSMIYGEWKYCPCYTGIKLVFEE